MDANSAAKLISATADIALVLDGNGIIEDISWGPGTSYPSDLKDWIGKPWSETVTVESRKKIDEMFSSSASNEVSEYRQINHPLPDRKDLPIKYLLHKLGNQNKFVAIGHDQSAIAKLQQRLIETQQSVEREYSRLRLAETRYRLLFQIVREPVLIVEGGSHKIREANPVALELLGADEKKIIGRSVLSRFDSSSRSTLEAIFDETTGGGFPTETTATLADGETIVDVNVSSFRQGNGNFLLVRLLSRQSKRAEHSNDSNLSLLIDKLPDAFVVTDADYNIISANTAFLDIVQLANFEQVRGQPIQRWLGRTEIDYRLLLNSLTERDTVRSFDTAVRGDLGSVEDVEASVVKAKSAGETVLGFSFRTIPSHSINEFATAEAGLEKSVEKLSELVGKVPLKEIVRETTDMIERLCIEAALNLTEDNRASAADILGVSRQSLYVKLRRFGMQENVN